MKMFHLLVLALFLSFKSPGQGKINPSANYSSKALEKVQETSRLRRCATVARAAALRSLNPSLPTDEELERFIKKASISRRLNAARLQLEQVRYIPVVVHIIHQGEAVGAGSNLAYEQVLSQIEVLNEDFRRKAGTRGFNETAVGADIQLEFVLAEIDPSGARLAEKGIHRVSGKGLGISGEVSPEVMDAGIKPATFWDPTRYLNLWTVNLAGDLLGYAQLPVNSGLSGVNNYGSASAAETDGVVIHYSAFGSSDKGSFTLAYPYDKGRTATHEVGHWLGLRHIWGDGDCSADDYCSDTPVADGPNIGCPTGASSCGSLDMIENYMDYTNDACMNIFTLQQKERMQIVLENSPRRKELLQSEVIFTEALQANFGADKLEIKQGESIRFLDQSSGSASSWSWTFVGGSPVNSNEQHPVVFYNSPGTYAVSLNVSNAKTFHELRREGYITVRAADWVNSAPYLLTEIAPQVLQVEETKNFSLDELFADVDGHQLTYAITVEKNTVLQAKLTGAFLNLKGIAGGTSRISITASDTAGGKIVAVIECRVNSRPAILAMPENQLLQVNEFRSLALQNYFSDPDGDALFYTVFTDGSPLLKAGISTVNLELTGLSSGVSLVKIMANDQQGAAVEVALEVEVNQQPDILQVPESQWLVLEQDTLKMDLSLIFSDLEGADLSYRVALSDTSSMAYELKENYLSFAARKAGEGRVVLQASDDKHGLSEVAFYLGGHHAPFEQKPLEGLEVGMGESLAVHLSDYFSDADADKLSFTAISQSEALTVNMEGEVMHLNGLSLGKGTVHIAVQDEKGASLEKLMIVQVVEPLAVKGSLSKGKLACVPNPVNNLLVLQLEGVKPVRYQVFIFDLQGRVVKSILWEPLSREGQKEIDLSLLPSGTYLLEVRHENGNMVQRVVKK